MRNLKFRTWDALHKKMLTGGETLSQFHPDGSMYAVVYDSEGCSAHIPLMQYTGLKDKNGVEIYEGDIVQITFDWGYGPGSVYAEVVFEDAGYKFKSDAGCAYGTDGSSLVVGNIYQHPELLEQGE